jgi:hypothetical protein
MIHPPLVDGRESRAAMFFISLYFSFGAKAVPIGFFQAV